MIWLDLASGVDDAAHGQSADRAVKTVEYALSQAAPNDTIYLW